MFSDSPIVASQPGEVTACHGLRKPRDSGTGKERRESSERRRENRREKEGQRDGEIIPVSNPALETERASFGLVD